MKVAHVVRVTPRKCGLYETTRELVVALRALGVDSKMVPFCGSKKDDYCEPEDRGAPITAENYLNEADVIVNHSGLNNEQAALGKPIIHVIHGRPRSSFLLEQKGEIKIYSFYRTAGGDPRYKAFVTFWQEHMPFWEVMLPKGKLHSVPAPVDLDAWTPDGPTGYGFHGHKGSINVVCTDVWRADVDPFFIIHGFVEFAKTHPGAKLHLYGGYREKAWDALLKKVEHTGVLGQSGGWVQGLEHVYHAADMVITAHHIATRTIREALACGCPVVADTRCPYTEFTADAENPVAFAKEMGVAWRAIEYAGKSAVRTKSRLVAERCFNPAATGAAFAQILERVVSDGRSS